MAKTLLTKKIKKNFAILQLLMICSIGTLKVIVLNYLKKNSSIHKEIRQRAKKIMKITQASYNIIILSKSNTKNTPIIHALYNQNYGLNPRIYMSNHLSLLDIPLIYALIPGRIKFIAKNSLFKLPLFGQAIHAAGIISTAHHNLYDILKTRLHHEESSSALWIFPEGHRSPHGTLLDFKAGGFILARELKAKIIPVGITGTNILLPAKTLQLNTEPNIKLQLCIGSEINCEHYQRPEQIKALMDTVRKEIQQLISN